MEIQIFSKALNRTVTLSEPKIYDVAAGVCGVIHEDYEDIVYNQYPELFEVTPNIVMASLDYCALGVSIKNTETGKTYHAIGDINSHDTFVKNERTKNLYENHPLTTCYGSVFDKVAALATGIPERLLLVDHPELAPVFDEAKHASVEAAEVTAPADAADTARESDQQTVEEAPVENETPATAENVTTETETSTQTSDQNTQDRATMLSAFVIRTGKYNGKTLGQIESENSGWFQYISKNTKPEYREAIEYGRLRNLIKAAS